MKDNVEIPKGKDNLVYQAAEFVYNAYGKKMPGLKIIQENNIPMARGMGSSSGVGCWLDIPVQMNC